MQKRGFSYIEVLIALAVSATIFTAILPLLFEVITTNKTTQLKLIAYEEAENKIESFRQSKISSLCPNPLPQTTPCDYPFTVAGIPGSTGDVYVIKNLGDQKIASVDVVISWQNQNVPSKVEMRTYLYGSME